MSSGCYVNFINADVNTILVIILNIIAHFPKGTMERALPWQCGVMVIVSSSHARDALTSKLFKNIDEMLLCFYYEKSPKKSHELVDVVTDLKEIYEFTDGGDLPIRSQVSRWIMQSIVKNSR